MALGTGGTEGVIHRAVWGPGVTSAAGAFHYVDDRIADIIEGLEPGPAVIRDASEPRLRLLDLGCGVGASLCHIARRLDASGTGITLSPVQARLAAAPDRGGFLSMDGIHMKEPYHRLMALAWLEALEPALSAARPAKP